MKAIKKESIEDMSAQLLSIDEAAAILKQAKPTIYNWLSQKKFGLKRIKLGNRTFIHRAQIEKIMLSAFEGK